MANMFNNITISSLFPQDYGECTPTAEKNLIFPRFPASSDRPSLPMSQLVRKLSEVEGISPSSHNGVRLNAAVLKTSLDEGVSVDIEDSQHHLEFQLQQHQQQQQQQQQQQHQQLISNFPPERIPAKASSFDSASLTSCGSAGIVLAGDAGIERATRWERVLGLEGLPIMLNGLSSTCTCLSGLSIAC